MVPQPLVTRIVYCAPVKAAEQRPPGPRYDDAYSEPLQVRLQVKCCSRVARVLQHTRTNEWSDETRRAKQSPARVRNKKKKNENKKWKNKNKLRRNNKRVFNDGNKRTRVNTDGRNALAQRYTKMYLSRSRPSPYLSLSLVLSAHGSPQPRSLRSTRVPCRCKYLKTSSERERHVSVASQGPDGAARPFRDHVTRGDRRPPPHDPIDIVPLPPL